jgi:hypothetical protein
MATSIFTLRTMQKTPGFITRDNLLVYEKRYGSLHDKLTTDPHAAVTLFYHQLLGTMH